MTSIIERQSPKTRLFQPKQGSFGLQVYFLSDTVRFPPWMGTLISTRPGKGAVSVVGALMDESWLEGS